MRTTASARAVTRGLLALSVVAATAAMAGSNNSRTAPLSPETSSLERVARVAIASSASREGIRVATYNIHSGLGPAFSFWQSRAAVERNLREIAGDIVAASPYGDPTDVVALNEVDFGSRRSAWIDEAAFLANELRARTGESYEIVRGQTWERSAIGREVRFGNALLVRLPILAASECLLSASDCAAPPPSDDLPPLRASGLSRLLSEERGVIKVTVRGPRGPVDILATHLDPFSGQLREGQATHLLHRFIDPSRSTILLGDLNTFVRSLPGTRGFSEDEQTLGILTSDSLADARTTWGSTHGVDSASAWATYPASAPVWPLDAVLASKDLLPADIAVIGSGASDHRGVSAMLVSQNAG